jgi:hypothetical protein
MSAKNNLWICYIKKVIIKIYSKHHCARQACSFERTTTTRRFPRRLGLLHKFGTEIFQKILPLITPTPTPTPTPLPPLTAYHPSVILTFDAGDSRPRFPVALVANCVPNVNVPASVCRS